jgi:cytidylate kinase
MPFFSAKSEVRAKRRLEQIHQRGNEHISIESVLSDTKTRDEQDLNRKVSPLAKNPQSLGYYVVDNSELSESETVDAIMSELVKKKLL